MPAITQPKSKKAKAPKKGGSSPLKDKELKTLLALIVAGAFFGLSAPGINQWYIAWFGLAPLLIAVSLSSGFRQAFIRGLFFGTSYCLVYANFLLGLQPLDWLGFNWWQSWLLAGTAWMILCLHQGLITAIFCGLARLLPMTGSFFFKKEKNRLAFPALLVIPLGWVLIHNFIGNAHDALGIPWTMIEYSQYKQHYVIQVASAIGGVGIGFLLVMWNTALAALLLSLWKKKGNTMLAASTREHAFYQLLGTAALLTCFMMLGFYLESQSKVPVTTTASVLQGNINIDMQKTKHRYSLPELLLHYRSLVQRAPAGICVWSENALPTYLRSEQILQMDLGDLARRRQLDMVVGSMDQDSVGRPFNSAYGIARDGKMQTIVYHKRFLVPFGEYTPWLIEYFPSWIKRLTNTPAGGGFAAGKEPVVLSFSDAHVSPLICFETLSPELVASSVRAGGQIIVNVSDLAWFHRSIIGDQMIAFSVLRAVENRRCFVFAANTGPSAIIESDGKIQVRSGLEQPDILIGKVGPSSSLTPFTRWFVF
jgi:apolipoprotein N-acyltransferase